MLQRWLLSLRNYNVEGYRSIVKQVFTIMMKLTFQIQYQSIFGRQLSMSFKMVVHIFRSLTCKLILICIGFDHLIIRQHMANSWWKFVKIMFVWNWSPFEIHQKWWGRSLWILIGWHITSQKLLGRLFLCWAWLNNTFALFWVQIYAIFPIPGPRCLFHYPVQQFVIIPLHNGKCVFMLTLKKLLFTVTT